MRWGLVATILSPTVDVLRFVAFHLDAGAHRLYIYLDDPDAEVHDILKAHSKIRVQKCNDAYWKKLGAKRPAKHQVRQTANATHAYNRKVEVDWLTHIDVDEFIVPDQRIDEILAKVPDTKLCARMRPTELLVGTADIFKAFIPNGPDRTRLVENLYPEFGSFVKGGFLSHVAGKYFVRTGINGLALRIHNVFQGVESNPSQIELHSLTLAHCHAKPFDEWLTSFRYRLNQGSYRASLGSATKGGPSLHDMFVMLEETEGTDGLRRFFDEVAVGSPEFQARLKNNDLLRKIDLDLDAKLARHFPNFT